MREIGVNYDVLVVNVPIRDDVIVRASNALTHQAKNLYNTGVFLIRQVESAYVFDVEKKVSIRKAAEDLKENQIDAIAHFNATIERINAARETKHAKKSDPEAKLKLIQALAPEVGKLSSILLDETLLDNVTRDWENENGDCVYARLPSAMAQQVLRRLKDAFSSYYAALKAWNNKAAGMTGRPQMPGYLEKDGRFVIEMPLIHLHGPLPSLKGKTIPEDYAETISLPEDVLAHVGKFDVKSAIDKACKARGFKAFKAQRLRIVPLVRGVKFEAVIRVENPYPEHSFLAALVHEHGETLAGISKAKQRDQWLAAHLKDLPMDQMPRVAAIDMGLNNLASMAFSTGHKAVVTSGGRFDACMGVFNDRIDAFISRHTSERARTLQAKKVDLAKRGEKLPKAEEIALRKELKAIYANPEYRKLIEQQKRWKDDFLHKLSRGLVKQADARKIGVIVIGRNKGWKQEVEMGKGQNRRFCQAAHARLIELIRYKAEARGIAVIEVEESYTSKTSFVENEPLRTKDLPEDTQPARPSAGTRSARDRNRFAHKNRHDRWKVVHSDVNGAFNIIRKAFSQFRYHVGLTLKFTLYRVSARCGMTPILLKNSG